MPCTIRRQLTNPSVSLEKLLRHPFMADPKLTVLRALWILRGLQPEMIDRPLRRRSRLAELRHEEEDLSFALPAVGLEEAGQRQYSRDSLRQRLRKQWLAAERWLLPAPGPVCRNAEAIAELLELNAVETQLLLFTALLHEDRVLIKAIDCLGDLTDSEVPAVLAQILGCERGAAAEACHRHGMLALSGLVRVSRSHHGELRHKLDLLEELATPLFGRLSDPVELLEDYFRLAPAARFDSRDFAHLCDDLHWLSRLLEQAVRQQTEGVNVLIFGPPGTGKTELVRTLAKQLGLALYEVSTADRDGDPLSPERRIRACQLAQRLLRRRGDCVLLFDEIEDVFPQHYPEEHSFQAKDCNKGWINQLLETNPVPALWLSNRVRHIDNAFLRRFDFVLEMETPPKEVRQRILRQHLEGLPVSANWLNRISELEQLTPAHIGRAARVIRLIAPDAAEANERCLERIMTGSLEVMGFATRPTAPTVVSGYDPALVHASMDLAQLAEGLARTGSGRICLYGPPGTGKSAYAVWLVATLNRPLVKKLASDLLNCFVGGTEANLAAMFREAEQQNAVLLLDEADSFLQDRQGAQRSWEVTQVNELLVQMETFPGIFICATNLMERLDPAVLRRFDVKIKLEYLKPGQAERLFRQALSGADQPDEAILKGLRALTNLTPGDFATVTRLARVIGLPITSEWLLAALTEECRAKPGISRAIGFVV